MGGRCMAGTPSTRPLNETGAECLAAGAHRDLPPERELVALTLKLAAAAIR